MSVLINMEMPKKTGAYSMKIRLFVREDGTASIWGLEEYIPNEPLDVIPVPPHGDLIDRDALEVIGYCGIPQGYEDTFDSGVMWLAEQIDKLPTIIPAEEGET